MIKLENITREYRMGEDIVRAVSGISLEITEGEFVALVGPSGSGKSTTMHIIGGLDTPTSGRVIVDGHDLSRAGDRELSRYRNEKIGFVFQAFNLHPTYTATENVALPLIFSGIGYSRRMKIAAEALETVGLSDRASHRPNQLSGGERQRVSIARALVTQPKIILADEPTGNLDSKNGQLVMELLSRLNKEKGITLIIVTHNMEIAAVAGRIIKMRDGKIVED
ncbi:MAG: ABC transporter ATP-binding protein [Dehalococcoidales bacterium]|jgi:putative ABC transport system ATP-binding protein|nr:ABC transporter ATP-binding protein [Dehalococcoidales bacterium]